jgi:hypothetical protein
MENVTSAQGTPLPNTPLAAARTHCPAGGGPPADLALDNILRPASGVHRTQHHRLSATTAAVLAATLMFFGISLSFLMNTPLLQSPDELFHFDRIMASAHGHLAPDPGGINLSEGSAGAQNSYLPAPQAKLPLLERFAVTPAPARSTRLSYDAMGGDTRSSKVNVPNYLTQHPPLYYAMLGGVTWLLPNSTSMPTDLLIWILTVLNILMMLPLPYLMYRSARVVVGENAIARAAAFLPLLVPGLAHSAASLNNDNLAIVIGAAVVALSLAAARGDRSARTAWWIAGLCVAGSLTKSTVLFVLMLVPIAYLIQAARLRLLPRRQALTALLMGAVGTAAWWVRNVIVFGQFQPDGYGTNISLATGNPRPAGQHAALSPFLEAVAKQIPTRFWAGLGLGGPPNLPNAMIWILTIALLVSFVVAVTVLRGRRVVVFAAFAVGMAAVGMICFVSFRHWVHFNSFSGLQGRYAYPGIFGVLFPMSIVCALLLGRWWRWSPLVICLGGSLVSGWAIYTSADLFWLLPGQALRPDLWAPAIHRMLSWSAVSPSVGIATLVLAALAWLGGGLLAGYIVVTDRDRRPLRQALSDPRRSERCAQAASMRKSQTGTAVWPRRQKSLCALPEKHHQNSVSGR